MKIILILPLLLWQGGQPAFAQWGNADSRCAALGYSRTMLTGKVTGFSVPASLSPADRPLLALHAENRWNIPELSSGSFSAVIPVRHTSMALAYACSGYSAFFQSRVRLAVSHSFGRMIRTGVGMEYVRIRQYADYGNLRALIPEFSVQLIPDERLVIGIDVINPLQGDYFPHGMKKIPALLSAGFGFSPDPKILVCFEYKNERDCRPVYSGGMEITLTDNFLLRVGLSSDHMPEYAIGIGAMIGQMFIDVSALHHPILGYSPALTLSVAL